MVYSDFFTQITMRHHVIYEDWPVSKFCSPGKMTLLELRRLYYVLKNGSPLFRRLSRAEWDALDLDSFQAQHAAISPTAALPLPTPGSNPAALGDEPSPNPDPTDDAPGSTPPANPSDNSGRAADTIAPQTAPPLSQGVALAQSSVLTLAGGQVCKPTQRRRRWDAGLTREQAAALKAVREAEKANKRTSKKTSKKTGGQAATGASQSNPQ